MNVAHGAGAVDSAAVDAAISRAVDFLAAQQRASGEFTTLLGSTPDLQDGVSDPSPFVTALVLHSLAEFPNLPIARAIVERGADYLERQRGFGGTWRYYARDQWKHLRVPPDLDDTSCASWALLRVGRSAPRHIALVLACRDQYGRFRTWMVPEHLRQWRLVLFRRIGDWMARRRVPKMPSEFAQNPRFANPTDEVPVRNVDPVVNANVLLYLGESAETRGAILFVQSVFADGIPEPFSDFYTDPLALCFMVMRASVTRAPGLQSLNGAMRQEVLARQHADGSFGPALSTALGTAVLAALDPSAPTTRRALGALLSAQRADGSWARRALYSGPIEFWGSEELTTALALDALARLQHLPTE